MNAHRVRSHTIICIYNLLQAWRCYLFFCRSLAILMNSASWDFVDQEDCDWFNEMQSSCRMIPKMCQRDLDLNHTCCVTVRIHFLRPRLHLVLDSKQLSSLWWITRWGRTCACASFISHFYCAMSDMSGGKKSWLTLQNRVIWGLHHVSPYCDVLQRNTTPVLIS